MRTKPHPFGPGDKAIFGPEALRFAESISLKRYADFPVGEQEKDEAEFARLVDEWRATHSK